MPLNTGDRLPDSAFLIMDEDGPRAVQVADLLGSGRAVLFGMPGAFTATCSAVHIPSVIRNMDAIRAKGVDTVGIVSVNDPFVMKAWGASNGATAAGITMLADPEASFSQAIGTFSAPDRGLLNRSIRYSLIVEDGKVAHLNIEEGRGSCDISGGDRIVELL
ncbi:peroxiredoxin [Halovulum dunhuangense]|uniref:Glutathione-dependent peroxiredoxin n=1 Tax=Halovulum dunhuangense TaxID=1505036 RepID=A0A849L5B5_9RHOB|nr:peroxiredoxin [Halovulum dunhuangense]NNU81648.1 peroxiredoxin [Halovulum dunhuangense]